MMIKAMEVSGIEGNFRTTCEAVLRVLRQHKDSLMVRARQRSHVVVLWLFLLTAKRLTKRGAAAANPTICPCHTSCRCCALFDLQPMLEA